MLQKTPLDINTLVSCANGILASLNLFVPDNSAGLDDSVKIMTIAYQMLKNRHTSPDRLFAALQEAEGIIDMYSLSGDRLCV